MYAGMRWGRTIFAAAGWAVLCAGAAWGQGVEAITVTGDPVRLLETRANSAAFGLDKPLIETPRAVTLVSDTTIARYGISGTSTT